jgi:ATP-dependent DNA helicase RecQ
MYNIAFIDIEVNPTTRQILDIGCICSNGSTMHSNRHGELAAMIKTAGYVCGHNLIAHDLKYLNLNFPDCDWKEENAIDTLFLSPLLFPQKPYHRLVKDDKLDPENRSNPLNDAIKAQTLLDEEITSFASMAPAMQQIYYGLLHNHKGFAPFFRCIGYTNAIHQEALPDLIAAHFKDKICANAGLQSLCMSKPVALAYTLALINCDDRYSVTPPWVLRQFPEIDRIFFLLRNSPCVPGCAYCNRALNLKAALQQYFGFDRFRLYDGEPLQEQAAEAALHNQSLLAVFPTGGGKSITFQLPALMAGENMKALTVVISPLQSLMKDQVDNITWKGISGAVTINGLLDPIERGKAIEEVENGFATLLYIAPESLRSVTIERLLLKRKIARFVIDEAHCFSAWGQDFRVDYLFIGKFIKKIQEEKNLEYPIPVSCFTATAKQKVIEDICRYFKENLNHDLRIFRSGTRRENLQYEVIQGNEDADKYDKLRNILEQKPCPAIVYVSRTKRTEKIAQRLRDDGFTALPYHGKMDKEAKKKNQEAFMKGETNIMVATTAFGMGVDKSNVEAVIHYDISDSLENYIQEAGRAGRDESIQANCYILFNEQDLDKHFILLNQTRINIEEIKQVWKAIVKMTKTRASVSKSALEIARQAGWDDRVEEIETRVTTAIAALEDTGYLKRGQNMPRVYATSILSKNAEEAIQKITASARFSEKEKEQSRRIIKKLFSSKSKRLATDEEAEARVDYIADVLAIARESVIRAITLMREEGILADTKDLRAFIKKSEQKSSRSVAEDFAKLEQYLVKHINHNGITELNLKEMNEQCIANHIRSNEQMLQTITYLWSAKNWIIKKKSKYSKNHITLELKTGYEDFVRRIEKRHSLSAMLINYLYEKAISLPGDTVAGEIMIDFSVTELTGVANSQAELFKQNFTVDDIEDTLFYLSKADALKIEGGFLVVYNRLTIDRLEMNNSVSYKKEDYSKLEQYYKQRTEQIHIVGEYARKMISNYEEALQFTDDYFNLNYGAFLRKYFGSSRQEELQRNMTPEKFRRLFGELSPDQLKIINDKNSRCITVAAGPGSGKTKLLVHKLASLLITEDVKHEQLLMLTFSRAAANEFKQRLLHLIGNAAHYVEIKTFHSFCFDLLTRQGNLEGSEDIVQQATATIAAGEVEESRITKSVLVVDEAQDICNAELQLILALIRQNEGIRVILVGDDDQCIYGFRGASADYMKAFTKNEQATKYELPVNYRSKDNIVSFSNQWVQRLSNRMKTFPCMAHNKTNGNIRVVEHQSQHLLTPVVEDIAQARLTGTTALLTHSNEAAERAVALLQYHKIPARLVQDNTGFKMAKMEEFEYLTTQLLHNPSTTIITDEEWDAATQQALQQFRQSSQLGLLSSAISSFASINNKKKYKSDWEAFLLESKPEDFEQASGETLFVSTMHKAKGKEFDNVYILPEDVNITTDDVIRLLYVAITRARTNLTIHYNQQYLQTLHTDNLIYEKNTGNYPEPPVIALSLGLKNVYLGHFLFNAKYTRSMISGSTLTIQEAGLGDAQGNIVVKFSRDYLAVIQNWQNKGYQLKSATVRCVVWWTNQETGQKARVLLPRLILSK